MQHLHRLSPDREEQEGEDAGNQHAAVGARERHDIRRVTGRLEELMALRFGLRR